MAHKVLSQFFFKVFCLFFCKDSYFFAFLECPLKPTFLSILEIIRASDFVLALFYHSIDKIYYAYLTDQMSTGPSVSIVLSIDGICLSGDIDL